MDPKQPITYAASGLNYGAIDPIKKLAQTAANATSAHLTKAGFREVAASRGESAYVWEQGTGYMASVVEHLGTKNLVADAMRKISGKTYYDVMAYDTIATIVNDLITCGAQPLVINAYWAVGNSAWLEDQKRMEDLITGWKKGCDDSSASWGGGETTSCKGIIEQDAIDLAGSAVGIIKEKKHLVTDEGLQAGDRMLLLKSTGINANGLTLARAIADKLPEGYATKLPSGTAYGDALLQPTNIYAQLIQDLQTAGVGIHYIANITGHGMRKIMRGRPSFSYIIEKVFAPHELFTFMQEHAGLSDYEMYQTFNMGQDYAIFISASDMAKALEVVEKNNFEGLDAGYVETGKKQVVIQEKNLVYSGETLDLR
jgi:phosphoribosylformylglycinamidine cyclo-ligase